MAGGKHFKTSGAGIPPEPAAPQPADGTSTFPHQEEIPTIRMDDHAEGYVRVRKKRRRRRKGPLIAAGVVLAIALAVAAAGGALAWSAYGVYQDAKEVLAEVEPVEEALTTGDAEALTASAALVEEKAAAMQDAVSSPLWTVGTLLPVVGTDIANARELVGVLYTLSEEALAPLAAQADSLNLASLIEDGRFNVELISELADLVVTVAPLVSAAAETVSALPEGSIEQVNGMVEKAAGVLESLDAVCATLDELAPYLEDLLGCNGTRTYLILAHNTSELKAGGGFIGSVGTITITDGVFELGEFSSFNDANLGSSSEVDKRLSEVTDEEAAIFTSTYGLHAGCSSINPDFPREGELSKIFWELLHREDEIDGCIALDSQVLAYFLGLTGSVTTADGLEVTAENCVETLGYTIYWEYFNSASYSSTSNDEADALFAEIAGLAFDAVVDGLGSVSVPDLLEVLATSFGEHRLMLWMDDDDEQAALEALGLSGSISDDETAPELGVYLQNHTASKLSWWTLTSTSWELVSENEDGSQTYAVTTTIENSITWEEVAASSTYIHGKAGGSALYTCFLYAPAGGSIADVSVDCEIQDEGTYTVDGADIWKAAFYVDPESTVTITYTVTTSAAAETELTLRTTPTAQSAS